MKNILIVAGESSGELYGSLLVKALKQKTKELNISGIGGTRMKQSDIEIISPICSAFGITEALKSINHLRQTLKKIKSYLNSSKPDAVILIDYPDFNLKVAKAARELGIPVLYYVSPQVWAWRKKRIWKIKTMIDKMALILPFEVEIYRAIDVPCEFVGHPVLDDIDEFLMSHGFSLKAWDKEGLKAHIKRLLNINSRHVIALMPGSRRHEISSLIQPIVKSAMEIEKKYPDVSFVLPIAPNLDEKTINFINESISPIRKQTVLIRDNPLTALACADIGIIASGTATFQATMFDVPMVVIYRVSRLTYLLGRLLIKVNYMTLTNLIIEKTIKNDNLLKIKELLQEDVTSQHILNEIERLLSDKVYYNSMLHTFSTVRGIFINHNASEKVCDMVLEMIHK